MQESTWLEQARSAHETMRSPEDLPADPLSKWRNSKTRNVLSTEIVAQNLHTHAGGIPNKN